jgi:penicillin-binding protein 1A
MWAMLRRLPRPRRARTGAGARRPVAVAAALAVVVTAAGCSYTTNLDVRVKQAASSQVFAADGTLLATLHADENRDPVPLAQISPLLQTAVVATEDARFFDHEGVDPRSVVRALVHDSQQGSLAEGGSTITQQYVRNVLLDRKKSVSRKLREAVLAIQVERKLSKRQILERYLNTVYFGNGAYGVQAAAHLYFATDAKNLDLAQSALLAGLLQAPEGDNPYKDPKAALARRGYVLDRVAKLGREPAPLIAMARAEPLELAPLRADDRYPDGHFIERVKQVVLTDPAFGDTPEARRRTLFEGGLRIRTTLDPKAQADAEQAIAKVLSRPGTDPAAALVSIDPHTGAVRAYVGGRDFFGPDPAAQFDLAGQAQRQSGSSFKPFVLAAALQAGIPLTRTYAAPAQLTIPVAGQPPWVVHNYDDRSYGRLDLVDATVESVNTVYAQLIEDVDPQRAVALAHDMGVRSKLEAVPSATLGTNVVSPLDMASAYSTFAADGVHADPVFVTKVTRRDGSVVYQAPVQRHQVLPASTSRQVTSTLEQVVDRGTGVKARIGRPVAGKTGTTDGSSDAWFVGYTPELATAVWVGFVDAQRPMTPPATRITVTGGTWPAQIWQLYQSTVLAAEPASPFPTLTVPPPSTTTTTSGPVLPSYVGMRLADAQRLLVSAGYQVRTDSRTSRQYPPGTVVAQQPAAGTPATPGEVVTIVLASGPPVQVAVPQVLGQLANQATFTLSGTGLQIQVTNQQEPPPTDPSRLGRIWKQAPAAGAVVDQGTVVTVWLNPA